MEYDPRIKLDVFGEPSVYKNDFCNFKPDKRIIHKWPRDHTEPPKRAPPPYYRRDLETYMYWHNRGLDIDFKLLIKPRPIIDTSPYTIYPQLEKPEDKGKEEAIKTRPRHYVSPAVSMDDIPDPEMRKLMCEHMYSSEWEKSAKEAASPITERNMANSTQEYGGDPVSLHIDLYPPLPPGWREKGKAWDNKQKRAFVDSTETFWKYKDPPVKCGACTDPYKGVVLQEVKNEIAELINKDKLRLAHDYPMPGYAGYKPRLSQGVPLSKTDLPVTHPFLSAAQAINKRYVDDLK